MPDRLLTISPLASRSFHDLTGQAIASKANSQSPALGHRLDRTISSGIWEKAPTPNKGRFQPPSTAPSTARKRNAMFSPIPCGTAFLLGSVAPI
jgi:hypothetical protein